MNVTPPDAKSDGTLFGGVTDWYQEPRTAFDGLFIHFIRSFTNLFILSRIMHGWYKGYLYKLLLVQVMAISVISVSSDPSEESMGTPAG
ncbi:hypothetical protein Tco_1276728 [Tanacetum coccineum]